MSTFFFGARDLNSGSQVSTADAVTEGARTPALFVFLCEYTGSQDETQASLDQVCSGLSLLSAVLTGSTTSGSFQQCWEFTRDFRHAEQVWDLGATCELFSEHDFIMQPELALRS